MGTWNPSNSKILGAWFEIVSDSNLQTRRKLDELSQKYVNL